MQHPGQDSYGFSGNQSHSNSRRGSVQRDFISSTEGLSGKRPSQPTSPLMSGRNTPNQYVAQQQGHFHSPPTHYSGPPTPAMASFTVPPPPPEYYAAPTMFSQSNSSPSAPLPSYGYPSGQQGMRTAQVANLPASTPSYPGYPPNPPAIPLMEPSRSPHQTQAQTGAWSGDSSSKQSMYAGAPIKLSSPPSRPGGSGSSPKTPQFQDQPQHSPGPVSAPYSHPMQVAAPVPQYPQGSPSGNVPGFPYPVQQQSQGGSPSYQSYSQPPANAAVIPQPQLMSWSNQPQSSGPGGLNSGVGSPPAYNAPRENSAPSAYFPNPVTGSVSTPSQMHGSPTQNLPKQTGGPANTQQPVAVTIGRIPVTPAPKVQVGVHAVVLPTLPQPQTSTVTQTQPAPPQVQVQPRHQQFQSTENAPYPPQQPSLPTASLYPIHSQGMQQAQPPLPRPSIPTQAQSQSDGMRQPTVLTPPDWPAAGFAGPTHASPPSHPPPPPYEATPQSSPPPSGMQTPIHDEGNGEERVCRHFLQGRCSWGASCRFEHPGAGTGSPPGAATVPSMAVTIPVGSTNPPPLANFPPPYSVHGYPNSSAPNSGFCSPEGGRSGAVSPTHPGTNKGFPMVTPTLSPSMVPMANPSFISSGASTSTGYMQGPTVTPYTSGSPSLANSMNLAHQLPPSLLQQASPLGNASPPGKEPGAAGGVTFHSSSWTGDMEIQIHRRQRSRPGSMPTSRTQSPKSVPLSPTESFGAIPPGFANAHSRPHSPSPATGVDPQSVVGSGTSLGGETRVLPTSALTSGRSTPLVANQVKFAHNPYVKGERDRELLNYSAPNSMHTTPTTRPFDLPS